MRAALLVPLLLLSGTVLAAEMISLPAGEFVMGSDQGMPDERPARRVSVAAFSLDRSPVSVAEFGRFVESTEYRSWAERYGDSGVFDAATGAWRMVKDADWRRPMGPARPPAPGDHPVTQVSWYDAEEYCRDAGGRLPTEAEFEYAAKGAGRHGDPVYAFGEDVKRDGDFLVNVFTGTFPFKNTGEDGYIHTAPVGKTGVTPLGLTDMAGNVWEWSENWYDARRREKTLRGGSFLCDEQVCHGYRTTARSHSTPETSLAHIGFRCAYNTDAPITGEGRPP